MVLIARKTYWKYKRSINFISKFLCFLTWLHVRRFSLELHVLRVSLESRLYLTRYLRFSQFLPSYPGQHSFTVCRTGWGRATHLCCILSGTKYHKETALHNYFLKSPLQLVSLSQNNFNKILLKGLNKCIFENILT